MPRVADDELDRMMADLFAKPAPRAPPPHVATRVPDVARTAPAGYAPFGASVAASRTGGGVSGGDRQHAFAGRPTLSATAAPMAPLPRAGAGDVAAKPPAAAAALAWPPDHGVALEQNARTRHYMEDAVVAEPLLVPSTHAFFAVYDGHGGRAAVDYVSTQLHRSVQAELKASRGADAPGALRRAFARTDSQLKLAGAFHAGTTAAVILLERPPPAVGAPRGEVVAHVANAGDSHVYLLDRASGAVERLSEEHSPKEPAEVERVTKAGGRVDYGRIGGVLAVTRALGDHALKAEARAAGLTAQPAVVSRPVSCATSLALVAVSDGVLEGVKEEEELGAIVRGALLGADAGRRGPSAAAEEAAKRLVDAALNQGSRDNISALVIPLNETST